MDAVKIGSPDPIAHPKWCAYCERELAFRPDGEAYRYICRYEECGYMEVIHHQKCFYDGKEEIRYWKSIHKKEN